jgi:hypothetical protein
MVAQQQVEEVIQGLQEELEKGQIERYGKELLYGHFRCHSFTIAGKITRTND